MTITDNFMNLNRTAHNDTPVSPPEHLPQQAVPEERDTDRYWYFVIENCVKYKYSQTIYSYFNNRIGHL